MQPMLTQQPDLAFVGGLGDAVPVANDQLEMHHPARHAQLAYGPEAHGVAADYHDKRTAELHAVDQHEAAYAHEIAAGIHRVAAASKTDADALAARRASGHAVEVELAATQQVLSHQVATCGDLPGHPFRGNQHAEGTDAASHADHATKKARVENTPEAHQAAADAHRAAWSQAVNHDAKVAAAGLTLTEARLHADYHKVMQAHHAGEAERLRDGR